MSADFVDFLHEAYLAKPRLFSRRVSIQDNEDLLLGLQSVFSSWQRLDKMRKSSRRWSEADYVANVCVLTECVREKAQVNGARYTFRSSAVTEGDLRYSPHVQLFCVTLIVTF